MINRYRETFVLLFYRCTALYIRWADDLELRGSINEVRTVFNKAQRKGALPAEVFD